MSNVITGIDLYTDAINRCNSKGKESIHHQIIWLDAIDQSNPRYVHTYKHTAGLSELGYDWTCRNIYTKQNSGKTGGSRINHFSWHIGLIYTRPYEDGWPKQMILTREVFSGNILWEVCTQDLFVFSQGVWIIQSCLVYAIKINFSFSQVIDQLTRRGKMEIFFFFFYFEFLLLEHFYYTEI